MPNMKKVIECPKCGRLEYYGMLHWRNGKELCRHCMYDMWESESQWQRNVEEDFTFPLYGDGVDYTQMQRNKESTEEIF